MEKSLYLCTLNYVIMCSLESLKVDLRGLKDEVTTLDFNLDDTYFEALDGADVKQGSLHVSVSIRKATGFFEFPATDVSTRWSSRWKPTTA